MFFKGSVYLPIILQVGQDAVTLPGALDTPIPPSDAPVQLEWNEELGWCMMDTFSIVCLLLVLHF